jgi:hypothetical protein
MHMTDARKHQGELYLRDWLETPRGRNVDDSFTLNVNKIYDKALLEELLKFNHKGNFDRVMSLIVGMYMFGEMHNNLVRETNKSPHNDWFDRVYNGNFSELDLEEDNGKGVSTV